MEQFLGFGLPQDYEVFPKPKARSLPFNIKARLVKEIVIGMAIGLAHRSKIIRNIGRAIKRKFGS